MSTPPTVIRMSTGRLRPNNMATLPRASSAMRRVNARKDRPAPLIHVFSPIAASAVNRRRNPPTLIRTKMNPFG